MIAERNSKPLLKDTPTAAPQKPLSFRFHFTAAAQASLHRPAPRTQSRATLIPLIRPLDRRKGVLSHISPVSSTALIVVCRQPQGVFGICASPPQLPLFATAVLFSAAALTFSVAALTFSAAADPTPRVRSTLRFDPPADPALSFRSYSPTSPSPSRNSVSPFCQPQKAQP